MVEMEEEFAVGSQDFPGQELAESRVLDGQTPLKIGGSQVSQEQELPMVARLIQVKASAIPQNRDAIGKPYLQGGVDELQSAGLAAALPILGKGGRGIRIAHSIA